jgi:hypothetical protein
MTTDQEQAPYTSPENRNEDTTDGPMRQQNNKRQDRNQVQLTNLKNYKGNISEIGAIIVLKYKKLEKRVQFQVFYRKGFQL